MADLAAEKRYRLSGRDGDAHYSAGRAVDPARQIDRIDRRCGAYGLDHGTRRALDGPVEASTEQGVDDNVRPHQPRQRCAATAASPLSRSASPTKRIRTRYPRSPRMRAATKPSPPLLPGPATIAIRRPGGCRAATASATARPALSIRSIPAIPLAMLRRSASAISAVVSNSIIAGRD